MNLLNRALAFNVPTAVEWRSTDGVVLQTVMYTPQTSTSLLLTDYAGPYDVFASEQGGEWRLIYEVRPQPNGLIVDWKAP
jgi:hypothetical protein